MKCSRLALFVLLLAGCDSGSPRAGLSPSPAQGNRSEQNRSLSEARRGFQTRLLRQEKANEAVPQPPADVFRTVYYDSPAGKLAAYLSPAPGDGKRHPAIIWITGGDCNSIGECWSEAPPSNDQTARAFREAGIIMMFPSLRGGNTNPGVKEGFLGEVDDVVAAADYLAKQDFVDAGRTYLGGHSTGGTLVLLVAEVCPRFRGVFSFGPVATVGSYPPQYVPFDTSNQGELELRTPALWLQCIQCPLFVFEGTVDSNLAALEAMARISTNPKVHFHPIRGANHFSTLAPATRLIAAKVLRDDGPTANITFSQEEMNGLMGR